MIRFACPGCGRGLSAKDELAGQTRKCPKCGTAVEVPPAAVGPASAAEPESPPAPSAEGSAAPAEAANDPTANDPTANEQAAAEQAADSEQVQAPDQKGLPTHARPERLNRNCQYLICDRTRVWAIWQSNGKGWLLKTNAGLLPAARNRDQLPGQGNFKLVEFQIDLTDAGRRLTGLMTYQLATSWALTALAKTDDAILAKVTGPGSLNKEQKSLLRTTMKAMFMTDILEHAQRVYEFLDNTDYHSPGTG